MTARVSLFAFLSVCVAACTGLNPPEWELLFAQEGTRISIWVDPTKAFYHPGDQVTVGMALTDEHGEPLEELVDVTWEVFPEGAATPAEGNTWILESEGDVTFSACVYDTSGQAICAERTILVDAAPPGLQITRPLPGEELLQSEAPTIVVEGHAPDIQEDVRVFVNGVEVSVDGDGGFQTELDPEFGVNHILVEATDGLHRVQSTRELDVLWAPGYMPPNAGDLGFLLDEAVLLRIGQTFFDDKEPLDLESQPVEARDLGEVVELILREADLMPLIPNPVVDSAEIQLSIDDVSLGDILLDIDLREGDAVEIFVHLVDVQLETAGQVSVADQTYNLDGTITATLSLLGRLELVSSGGGYQVDLVTAETFADRITGEFADPMVQVLFEVLNTSLRQAVDGMLEEELAPLLTGTVPDLLEDALGALTDGLVDVAFDLDTGFGPALAIHLAASLDDVDIEPGGYGALLGALGAEVGVTDLGGGAVDPHHADSRGAAMVDANPDAIYWPADRLQVAARLDLINGLLHALWNGGLLDFASDELVPGGEVEVEALLPPVVRPARPGEPFDLVADVGQLQVTAQLGDERGTFGIAARAGATMELADNALMIDIDTTPSVRVWSLDEEPAGLLLTVDTVRSIITGNVWPSLFEALGDDLAIEIPLPELSELGIEEIAPGLADAELSLVQKQPLDIEGGYLLLSADLFLTQ